MTVTHNLIVVDTNVIVSAIIFRRSIPYQALLLAFENGDVLSSPATRLEAKAVLAREKFDDYVPLDLRMTALDSILKQMKDAEPVACESECRDPKDQKFLELAFGSGASLILSGDVHLLELHPFRGIAILSPAAYLESRSSNSDDIRE